MTISMCEFHGFGLWSFKADYSMRCRVVVIQLSLFLRR